MMVEGESSKNASAKINFYECALNTFWGVSLKYSHVCALPPLCYYSIQHLCIHVKVEHVRV